MAKHKHLQNSVKHRNRKYHKKKKARKTRYNRRHNKISNTIKRRTKAEQRNINNNTNLRFIKNLSSHKLTTAEINALGKGLKFIPTPKRPHRIHLTQDVNKFIRRIRLQYIMRHKKTENHEFKVKSMWTPHTSENTNLENYLEATKLALVNIPFHNTGQNMTRAEKIAIRTLSRNRNVTIKPFDKGRGTAIIDTIDYINECERQLSDQQYYTKLLADNTAPTIEQVYSLTAEMYDKKHIDYHTFKYLDPFNFKIRTPRWYLLPKIHKPSPPKTKFAGRPIISGCSSPTFRMSEFVDHFLKQVVVKQSTYIKDTTEFIRKIETIKIADNAILVTLDVVSMYTNTQHDEATQLIGEALDAERSLNSNQGTTMKMPPTEYMLAMLTLISKNNTFEFDNEFYK
ncbi:uncharacterized protein [Ptychodera flava]|uniref:uncharacterized protein n=1 Tax=Ptychodera flava TaxID=63121 RepID=UPI00396A9F8D